VGSSVFTAGVNSRGVDVCLGRHDTPLAFSDSGDTAAQPQTPVMRLWAMGDLTHSTHDGTQSQQALYWYQVGRFSRPRSMVLEVRESSLYHSQVGGHVENLRARQVGMSLAIAQPNNRAQW
jgi:hypothetical protein